MKKFLRLLTFLWVFTLCAQAQQTVDSVGLAGTIKNPDGSLFNGYMTLSLTLSGVKNTCSPPPYYQNVPRGPITYQIVNGTVINGATASFITQDCMSPRAAYYVSVYDNNHKLMFADNWYFHQQSVANNERTQDVGTLISSHFAGPIAVSLSQAIVGNPTGNQYITEPAGSNLIINSAICTGTCTGFGGGQGSGNVSSVGLTLPTTVFTVTVSPITSAGNLTATLNSQSANTVFAGPLSGGASTPGFRLLSSPDIPNNAANTTGTANNVTGIVAVVNGGTGVSNPSLVQGTGVAITGTWPNQTISASLIGSGTPSQMALYQSGGGIAGDPNVTDSGSQITLNLPVYLPGLTASECLATNSSNVVISQACSNSTGSVTSVALTAPAYFTVTGSPVTSSGTLALTATTGEPANEVLATPNGTTGALSLRALASGDIPNNAANTTGSAGSLSSFSMPALGTFASAATLNFGSATGGYAYISGSATVSTITVPSGCSGGSIACSFLLESAGGFVVQSGPSGGTSNNINLSTGYPSTFATLPSNLYLFTYDPVNGFWHMSDAGFPNIWQGAYNSATNYSANQMVSSGGQTYVSLQSINVGNTPPNSPTYWTPIGLSCSTALCLTPSFTTSLTTSMTSSQTTASVNSIAGLSATGGTIWIDTEYMSYAYVSGTTVYGLTRGAYGTSAATHNNSAQVAAVIPLGVSGSTPGYTLVPGYAASPILSLNNPFPNGHAGNTVLEINSGANETYVDSNGIIHQLGTTGTNQMYQPLAIGTAADVPAIASSGYVLQSNGANEAFSPLGFGGGIAGSVTIGYTPVIAAATLQDATSGGTTTRTYVCSATDFDGNTIPGTAVSDTTSAASYSFPQFVGVTCPWSAGIASYQLYRTAGGPNTGYLGTINGINGAEFFDYNQSATTGTPPATNGSNPTLSIVGSTHTVCDSTTSPNTCMVLGTGVPSGCGATYGLGSSYGNETGGLTNLFYLCSPPGTVYKLGVTATESSTATGANTIYDTYFQTSTNAGGYTVTSASIYVGTGGTSGDKIDVGIITAPTATTQGTSWLCHAAYTETSTPPNGYVTVTLSGCGTLSPNTYYWLAYDTNDTGVNIGRYNCGSTCSGTAGSSTYGYLSVAGTYGTYTGLTTSLTGPATTQVAEYITMTGVSNEWVSINNLLGSTSGGTTGGNVNAYTEATLTGGSGVTIFGAGFVTASTVVNNAGHFTNLQLVNQGSACTTPPYLNVFDGTSNVGTPVQGSPGGTAQTKGTGTNQSQTLTFNAGDTIGIYVSTAASGCSSGAYVVSAQYVEAP